MSSVVLHIFCDIATLSDSDHQPFFNSNRSLRIPMLVATEEDLAILILPVNQMRTREGSLLKVRNSLWKPKPQRNSLWIPTSPKVQTRKQGLQIPAASRQMAHQQLKWPTPPKMTKRAIPR